MSNSDSLILRAAKFAASLPWPERKYSGRPGITHMIRVAGRVCTLPDATEIHVAVAWLHDVVEDFPTAEAALRANFPTAVIEMVIELTNPSKQQPWLNRAARKHIDRQHLAKVSEWAQIIKLIDRIDNVRELSPNDKGFTQLYLQESSLLVDEVAIANTNDIREIDALVTELREAIRDCYGAAAEDEH